jgi:hypothetical protein
VRLAVDFGDGVLYDDRIAQGARLIGKGNTMTRTAEEIGAEIDELLDHKVDPMAANFVIELLCQYLNLNEVEVLTKLVAAEPTEGAESLIRELIEGTQSNYSAAILRLLRVAELNQELENLS